MPNSRFSLLRQLNTTTRTLRFFFIFMQTMNFHKANGKTSAPIYITNKIFERHSDSCAEQMYEGKGFIETMRVFSPIIYSENCCLDTTVLKSLTFVVFFKWHIHYLELQLWYTCLSFWPFHLLFCLCILNVMVSVKKIYIINLLKLTISTVHSFW